MNELTVTPTADDSGLVSTTELSDAERHRLLANERRRVVLDALSELRETTDVTSLGELASAVDRTERREAETDDAPGRDLLVDLHHVHLPLFDDLGIVDYETASKRIHIGD